tara:strand:- start:306 stop:1037 length:732 start_codon:yes stop_codon:yes gene_type:complete
MAVKIDTVYQRVLALANKEQRGYITPQEFNLFANQAQMEIFEQYFYDEGKLSRNLGNDTEFSDALSLLQEKISIFERERGASWVMANMQAVNGYIPVPTEIYRLGTVRVGGSLVEMLTSKEFDIVRFAPLTAPTLSRPVSYLVEAGLVIAIGAGSTFATPTTHSISLSYIRQPVRVQWGYVVISGQALYNEAADRTTNFELHSSEETELVYKILKLAGVAMRRDDIMKAGQGLEMLQVQQEKQ